jgi:vaccinia related kinase
MPPKGAKKKASSGYQMPEQFTAGTVLNDIFKKPWCLGKPIGQGGFGLIYTANRGESQPKNSDDAEFVIKIEPKSNGPLFSEIHFYTACAKEDERNSIFTI